MKILMIALLSMSAFTASASIARPATKQEVKTLCNAVDKVFEEEQADGAVDLKKCYKAKMTTMGTEIYGTIVTGKVPVNSPNRAFSLNCQGTLASSTIESKSVSCK